MEPFGLAIKDYFEGKRDVKIIFLRDDGIKDEYSVSYCFRSKKEFSPLERHALELCHGKILDIGAGVGPDSLELQNLGFEVFAIDISSHACEIMKKRGVKNVKCISVYDLDESNFDTLILISRSIGFVEDLSGLKKFLNYCKTLLNPDGQVLLDSLDVRMTTNPDHLAYQEKNRQLGRYFGEVGLQMEYKGVLGENFKLLHIDPQSLKDCAEDTGWSCEILYKGENGNYLARISK